MSAKKIGVPLATAQQRSRAEAQSFAALRPSPCQGYKMTEVTVQTKPTVALDDATLGRIAALWTAAFPTADGRDRLAEAIERRATTAQSDDEQLHYVEDGDQVVAAARTFVRCVNVADKLGLREGRRVKIGARHAQHAHRCGTILKRAAADDWVTHLDRLDGQSDVIATFFMGDLLLERRVLCLAHVATAPAARGRGLGAAVVRGAFSSRLCESLPEALFCTGVPGFYEKLDCATLAPCDVVYPSEDLKKFVDPALMRFSLPTAPAWPAGGALHVNGAGW